MTFMIALFPALSFFPAPNFTQLLGVTCLNNLPGVFA